MSDPGTLFEKFVSYLKGGKGIQDYLTEEIRSDLGPDLDAMIEHVKEGKVKVGFKLDPRAWHGVAREWLWGEVVRGCQPFQAVLVNFPFYAEGVSFGDTVVLGPSDEDPSPPFYLFAGIVARGGHSTFHVRTSAESDAFAMRWPRLKALGCRCESVENETDRGPVKLFAVDVPPGADIERVTAILQEGARDGSWMFRAANLEHDAQSPRRFLMAQTKSSHADERSKDVS